MSPRNIWLISLAFISILVLSSLQIYAWEGEGEGEVTVTVTLLPAPNLSFPSNSATGISRTPTFTWSAVSGATSYRILVGTSLSGLPTDPTASTGTGEVINAVPRGTSYTPASGVLSEGVTYYWEVHARSPTQYGTWSSKRSFTTGTTTVTSLPTIGSFSVTISQGESGTTSFEVYNPNRFSIKVTDFSVTDYGGFIGEITATNLHLEIAVYGRADVQLSVVDKGSSPDTYIIRFKLSGTP